MEWEAIPQALSIRPCQRSYQLQTNQFAHYPVSLKKLPPWVDNATFQYNQLNSPEKFIERSQTIEIDSSPQKEKTEPSSQKKYQKKKHFDKIYSNENNFQHNLNFAYQFIPNDYKKLDQIKQKAVAQSSQQGQKQIQFQSNFECGNLLKVYKKRIQFLVDPEEYHLFMKNDLNTRGYTQWFCFSMRNFQHQQRFVTIRIVNFLKPDSLYKKGMKPWFIHDQDPIWRPIQQSCSYNKTKLKSELGQQLYELNFNFTIKTGTTYISMMPIYSYSRLCQKIQKWKTVKGMSLYPKKIFTLINNVLPVLEYIPCTDSLTKQQKKYTDTIVVSARTHPGEVWSSFMMEEFINNVILYHKSSIKKMRYLFIPMLNPDGVIYGNFRCDFSGVDLNRAWSSPHKYTEPAIFLLRKILQKQFQFKKAKYFIDLHSHSKNYNIFAYTCAESITQARIVPDLVRLSNDNKMFDIVQRIPQINPSFLMNSQTTFISNKDILYSNKSTTARAFMSQHTQKGNAVTIQISFFGYQTKAKLNKVQAFGQSDFHQFSWLYLKKLHDYLNDSEEVLLARKMLKNLYENYEKYISDKIKSFHVVGKGSFIDNIEDSDSQPEKYYAPSTVKKIKSKEQQRTSITKNLKSDRKKGYLKQTQSLIQRFQSLKRQMNLGKYPKKNNNSKLYRVTSSVKNKQTPEQKIQPKIQSQNVHQKAAENVQQKAAQAEQQKFQTLNSNSKSTRVFILQNSSHTKSFSNKLPQFASQSKFPYKACEYDSQKQTKQSIQSQNEQKSQIKNSFQPIDLTRQFQEKIQCSFGKFSSPTKRNFASRRFNKISNKEIKDSPKIEKVCIDNSGGFQSQASEAQTQKKQTIVDSPLKQYSITKDLKQNSEQNCTNDKNLDRMPMKIDVSWSLKQKKSQKYIRNNNFSDYISQRRKIVQFMKKQTRIISEGQKLKIEQIVNKRARSRTQVGDQSAIIQRRSYQGVFKHGSRLSNRRIQHHRRLMTQGNENLNDLDKSQIKISKNQKF